MKAALFAVVLLCMVVAGAAQSFAPAISSSLDALDPAAAASADSRQFAEGTRAINENRWADAVAIFSQVVAGRGDHADGALYWKAYAENKQGAGDRALGTCAELSKTYPQSRWVEDCGALSIEIRGHAGQTVQPENEQNDDLKLLALNSLMRQDEQRAVPQIEEALNGRSSPKFKERALFILSLGKSREARSLLARIAAGDSAAVRATPSLQSTAARLLNHAAGSASATVPGESADDMKSPPPPTIKTETRAVVVDVVVTRGENDPVGGLHQQDFKIYEDGKPQAIDFFEEHTSHALPAGAIAAMPQMPPNVYTNVPPAPESDAVNVLLLDSLNTDRQDQSYVRQQILNYLRTMQPGTRVAIFTLASKLRMIQGFTTDSAVLRDALNNPKYGFSPASDLASRSTQDKMEAAEHVAKIQTMMNGHNDAGVEAVAAFEQDFAAMQVDRRVGMTLEAMQYLARYLAGVPGRKNLIWFSTSFPIAVFPRFGQDQAFAQTAADSLRTYNAAVRETADLLTVSKVAVYPVGAEGVMTEHGFEANVAGPTDYEGAAVQPSGAAAAKNGCMNCYANENAARSEKIMAMEQLAADTGGKAYFNTNDLNAAVQHAIADGAHYYTIAYSPANKKMDGRYRHIEVKLPGTPYKLAYRHGYNADATFLSGIKVDADPLRGLMQRGMPNSTQILYGVRVQPATAQPAANAPRAGKNAKLPGPVTRYAADFMIRWNDVRLDKQADGRESGKVRVELMAYDHDGTPLNWNGGTEAMDLKPEIYAAIQKSGIPAHVEIDLPAGKDCWLVTAVFDPETGKIGTLEIPLTAQANAASSRP